jgi:hyperosmotically inducible periplasmic protein
MRRAKAALATAGIAISLATVPAWATESKSDAAKQAEAKQVEADNSGRNVRDADSGTLTPMDQSNKPGDLALTKKIRSDLVADDSLSLKAHNVKIISIDGIVTLRGPVENEAEKERIAMLAEKAAGSGKVRNHLEIAQ